MNNYRCIEPLHEIDEFFLLVAVRIGALKARGDDDDLETVIGDSPLELLEETVAASRCSARHSHDLADVTAASPPDSG